MNDLKVVQFKIIHTRLVADPTEVIVTRSQTLILFQLLISGLSFADTELFKPITVAPEFALSFNGPWRVTQNTASLLDLYNVFANVPYTVNVVRGAGQPFPLVFQPPLIIRNAMP